MTKGPSKQTSPDLAFQISVTTVEAQGILESFCKLPQTERGVYPLGGYEPRVGNLYQTLLGALIAHGTNLGLVDMAHSVKGITVDTLQFRGSSQLFTTKSFDSLESVQLNECCADRIMNPEPTS